MKSNNIQVKKVGRKPTNIESFDKIDAVKKGEFLIITKKEWYLRTNPGKHIIRKRTGREFKVESLVDGTGWKCTALN